MSTGPARFEGPRLYLRVLTAADVGPAYQRWMNDEEVTRFLESRFETHTIASLTDYVAGHGAHSQSVLMAIMLRAEDRHIGNIKLDGIDPHHRTADIGLLIGEKDCWGRGFATEAIELITRYAFEQLDLRKVTASCYSSNEASARAFDKVGFAREGVRPQQYIDRGEYVDQVLFGMEREHMPPQRTAQRDH